MRAHTERSGERTACVGFLGAGAMAEALASGFISSSHVLAHDVFVHDRNSYKIDALTSQLGCSSASTAQLLVQRCRIVFIAVKPHAVADAVHQIRDELCETHLLVSIAAGVPLVTLRGAAGDAPRIVRVMPNTPALVGKMAAALSADTGTPDEDVEIACSLLRSLGSVHVMQEKLIDAATGVSGSGPAYLYLAMEAMADGGVQMGLPRQVALNLAAETIAGAGEMASKTGKHPAQLKDDVTSAGGTTIAAVHELERNGVRNAFMDAVCSSAEKAASMGKGKQDR